ncbi:MAG: hypothetical protein R3C70_11375 [Geminicoccaceae bacterium]
MPPPIKTPPEMRRHPNSRIARAVVRRGLGQYPVRPCSRDITLDRFKVASMIEYLSSAFLYNLTKDAVRYLRGLRKKRTPAEQIALQGRWKPVLEEIIFDNWRSNLRKDVIIRDVERLDNYPETTEKRGISPWFRVGLIDTYHRGILVGLRWDKLVEMEKGHWRFPYHQKNEEGDLTVILAGKIPYESIEYVDSNGDEYYNYPHIYCHFEHKKEPYESVDFYVEEQNPGGRKFYSQIADYQTVCRASRKLGISHF